MNMNMEDMDNTDMSDTSGTAYTGDDPWYLRTLPGRTGDFMGHFVPGMCFGILGLGLLLFALWNARQLRAGESFVDRHIPERDPFFLRWFGMACMVGTTLGTFYEIWDKDPGFDAVALTHATLYASYFVIGICSLYESQGRLPADTHRVAMVPACLLQALIWYSHALMKKLPADAELHMLLAYVNIANGATVAYSVRNTDSLVAFLAGWAFLLLQGMWILLSGLYECCIDLHMHELPAVFAMHCLVIFMGIVLAGVYCGPARDFSEEDLQISKVRRNFNVLPTNDDDTFDDEEGGDAKHLVP